MPRNTTWPLMTDKNYKKKHPKSWKKSGLKKSGGIKNHKSLKKKVGVKIKSGLKKKRG